MLTEILKFGIYSLIIVIVSKYILAVVIRKLGENLELKPHTIGETAGIATSIPEFLTVVFSAINGLLAAMIANIFSSNLINLIQYLFTIIKNKNFKLLKEIALKIDLVITGISIVIPMILIRFESSIFESSEISKIYVLISIFLFIVFKQISKKYHMRYFHFQHIEYNEDERNKENINKKQEEKNILKEKIENKEKNIKTVSYIILLVFTGIILFYIGNLLGNTLNVLANFFGLSEFILGILLGFITSIPELITFFEAQKYYIKKDEETRKLGVVEASSNLITSNLINLFIIQSIALFIIKI